jgi:hypothetical protein
MLDSNQTERPSKKSTSELREIPLKSRLYAALKKLVQTLRVIALVSGATVLGWKKFYDMCTFYSCTRLRHS